jgi:hypothetical protein
MAQSHSRFGKTLWQNKTLSLDFNQGRKFFALRLSTGEQRPVSGPATGPAIC